MRLVVSGSRKWNDKATVYRTLDDLHRKYGVEVVYHGDAAGLDGIAKMWAIERGLPVFGCPYASAYDRRGGPVRNGWLLKYGQPDLLIAFPLPDSVGTWDCIRQAKALGIGIRIVKPAPIHAAGEVTGQTHLR